MHKTLLALLTGLGLCASAPAAEDPGLAAVRDLGRLNGQALACGQKDTAAWLRVLMLNHAPKIRAYGEVYEEGTQEAFVAHNRGAPCPTPAELSARIEDITPRLKLLPAPGQVPQGHSPAENLPEAISPRYLLQDPNGRAVTDEDFRGRFQLISFGYTSCPDVCPTTLLEMKEILRELGEEAKHLQPIFVTVDPERDSAQVLREYTSAFDVRILGLTGSPELVRRAADHFRVRYAKVREPGAPPEQYTIDHSAGMFLLGPDGSFLLKFAYATPPGEAAQRIRELIARRVSRPSDGSSTSRPPGSSR